MSLENKNILITAGGTGGHIYPALAVAQALQDNGTNVTWVGTPNSMESNIVAGKFDIKYINIAGVRKKSMSKRLAFPFKLTRSIFTAFKILKETKADLEKEKNAEIKASKQAMHLVLEKEKVKVNKENNENKEKIRELIENKEDNDKKIREEAAAVEKVENDDNKS